MDFPAKLAMARERAGLTQGELAKAVGLARSAVTDMEAGRRRPYMDQAALLARALNESLDFLADDSLDEPPFPELSEGERAVLTAMRGLEVDPESAIKAIAMFARLRPPSPAPIRHQPIEMEILNVVDLTGYGEGPAPGEPPSPKSHSDKPRRKG